MKPFNFKIPTFFAEEMKRELDKTEFEYTSSSDNSLTTDFQVAISAPDDIDIINEIELKIFSER